MMQLSFLDDVRHRRSFPLCFASVNRPKEKDENLYPVKSPQSRRPSSSVKAAGVFYGYSSIFVILQSIGVFTLFGCAADKTGAPRKEKSPGVFGKFVLEIDKCSFGIYLIHMIFVRGILKHTKLHPYGAGSPFVLISLTLGIFLVSFILTWILKKIPGVKKIL